MHPMHKTVIRLFGYFSQAYLVAVQLGHHILNASSKFVPETIGLPFVRG